MKKRMMAWGLLLLMVLSLFSGCKQVDAAGEAATPSEEVVNAPVTEKIEQEDIAEQPEQTDKKEVNASNEEYIDYFVCEYLLYLKEEYAGVYTLEDFGDIKADRLVDYGTKKGFSQTVAAPKMYYVEATYTDRQLVTETFKKLQERQEVESITLEYTACLVKSDDIDPQLPSIDRPNLNNDNNVVTKDGAVSISMEYDDHPINHIIAVSDFSDMPVEVVNGSYFSNEKHRAIADIYLTTRGEDAMNEAISVLKTYDYVSSSYLMIEEYVGEMD